MPGAASAVATVPEMVWVARLVSPPADVIATVGRNRVERKLTGLLDPGVAGRVGVLGHDAVGPSPAASTLRGPAAVRLQPWPCRSRCAVVVKGDRDAGRCLGGGHRTRDGLRGLVGEPARGRDRNRGRSRVERIADGAARPGVAGRVGVLGDDAVGPLAQRRLRGPAAIRLQRGRADRYAVVVKGDR